MGIATVLAVFLASEASAAVFPVKNARIVRLLTDAVNFGYCMAFLDATGRDDLASNPNCNNFAVSFNCQAAPEFNMSKAETSRNWAAAQLAFVSNGRIELAVDDAAKYNGQYCVARRIDNFAN
jgi:hypothetical protein